MIRSVLSRYPVAHVEFTSECLIIHPPIMFFNNPRYAHIFADYLNDGLSVPKFHCLTFVH